MKIKQKIKKILRLGLLFLPLFLLLFLIITTSHVVYGQFIDTSSADNAEIKSINNEIKLKQDLVKKKQDQQESLKKAIEQKREEKASLNTELAILDNRLEKARLDIESTEIEIDNTNLEIKKTNLEIEDKTKQITEQKSEIASSLNLLHKQDSVSSLEVLLLNDSLSEFLSQAKYLESISVEIKNSLENINDLKEKLEQDKSTLEKKKVELEKQKTDLEDKKTLLLSDQEDKSFILEQTKQSEGEYQKLLARAKQEQVQAANEIASLERKAKEKLAQLSKENIEFNDSGFIWPVPKNTITAYFHDPDYPFRKVFEHPAVDIRAAQGTTLRAAASGYVAIAKDAGMGYSYIMIVHGNGLSTVYGHVSKISVKADDVVVQGQVIGASGGMPGTPGAGNMTTGSHLHFEVRLNGIPVDPLSYLP